MLSRKSIFTAKVTYLPRKEAEPDEFREITLAEALFTSRWKEKVLEVREETEPMRQAALKDALPLFTPSGTFRTSRAAGLVEHSGYICIDLDLHDNTEVKNFASLKQHVHRVPYVAYCGRSCRGEGFFLLIPIADPAKHREYFRALEADFLRCGLKVDRSCKDVSRKRFVSYDPDPYVNTAAQVYAYTIPETKRTVTATVGRELPREEITPAVLRIIEYCERSRTDITSDYSDWFTVLLALARTYGEEGREFAHRISAIYPGYEPGECDRKFSEALRTKDPEDGKPVTIGSFFYVARHEIAKADFEDLVGTYAPSTLNTSSYDKG